jgi:hypothetical protein
MVCQSQKRQSLEKQAKDSRGRALAPDRFWNTTMETMIASDDSGPCLGIELNIWERAKVK